MSNRILDVTSIDKLTALVNAAREEQMFITIDFLGGSHKQGKDEDLWIIQIFDEKERTVVSARGRTANDAARLIHQNWFNKLLPVKV